MINFRFNEIEYLGFFTREIASLMVMFSGTKNFL